VQESRGKVSHEQAVNDCNAKIAQHAGRFSGQRVEVFASEQRIPAPEYGFTHNQQSD
jgi:hypothetical protein